jgi:tetratricopeptide (TPR) repeat protein
MEEDKFGFAHEEDIEEVVERFERMRKNNENYFFDVAEFEAIIDFYFDTNNPSKAYDAADAAVHQHPQSVSIQLRQARVLLDRGRAVETLKILKRLESIEPGNFEIYLTKGTALGMLGDINGAKRMFDQALAVDNEERENILYTITSILQNLNYYDHMIVYMHKLIELEPDFFSHYYDLAYAYEKVSDMENAVKYYELYLHEEPFSDSAWYNLGIIHNKLGNYSGALEAYEYSLAINPQNTFALFNKGNILSNEEKYEQAVEVYLEYLELEPESSEAMTYLGECYEKLGKFDRAKKYFQDAIELVPENPEPWFGLGVISFRQGAFSDAVMIFGKCTRLDEQNPEYYHMLARSLYASGRRRECVRNLKKTLKADPFFDEAWIDMGNIVHETGSAVKILKLLVTAHRIVGDVPGLNYLLAASYLASGNNEDAFLALSRAADIDAELFDDFSMLFPDDKLTNEMINLFNQP